MDGGRLEDRQITISRVVAASVEKVWRCWTDPALLPRWFGPDGYSCQTKEIDLRVGGVWRFDMIGHGMVWPNRHRFTLHELQARIEFLMDGDDDAEQPMEVVVVMVAEGAGTRLSQTITFPTAEGKTGALGFGADKLGLQTLGKLAAIAEAL